MEKLLLDLLSELYVLDNSPENWKLKLFANNPPRYLRLKMIHSLLEALEIKCNVSDFLKGDFFNENQLQKSKEIQLLINTKTPFLREMKYSELDIKWGFTFLINYRLELLKTSEISKKYLAVSGFLINAIEITNKINHIVLDNLKEMDEILCLLINPNHKKLNKKELIKHYSFPDVNLKKIDIQYM